MAAHLGPQHDQDPDNKVRIPGFYDSVKAPNDAQLEMLASIPDDTEKERQGLGLKFIINGMTGAGVHEATSFSPTANILGIEAGYNGPGSKTVLPKEARAKLDIRLVPDQDPEAILASLQSFMKSEGFDDIEVRRIENEGDLLPAASDPSSPFVQSVLRAARDVSGRKPVVTPSSGGSGPMAPFTAGPPAGLGIPTAAFGVGYPDSRAHGPDENIPPRRHALSHAHSCPPHRTARGRAVAHRAGGVVGSMRPEVSVVILNWNGARLLPECLSALASQTYRDFELWLVDNGSIDGSSRLLDALEATAHPTWLSSPLPRQRPGYTEPGQCWVCGGQ